MTDEKQVPIRRFSGRVGGFAGRLYQPSFEAELVEQYDDKQLALICDYLEKTSELSQRELAKAIAANRGSARKGKRTSQA